MSGARAPSAAGRLYGLTRALRSNSEYARRMRFLSDSIFGEVRRPTPKPSLRVVQMMARKPYEQRKEIVQYYPPHDDLADFFTKLRAYGLYRDEHKDFVEEMERKRFLRGKVKTRKYSTFDKSKQKPFYEEEEDE